MPSVEATSGSLEVEAHAGEAVAADPKPAAKSRLGCKRFDFAWLPTPELGLARTLGRALEWKPLLCPVRERDAFENTQPRHDPLETRSEFERDYDRAVFSTPLRRLQDKTQVFPLEPNDFVRTRLTHSLEVSTLARGLARRVGAELVRTKKLDERQARDVEAIAATCALIHDLGNPPFGHAGERAIQEWFDKRLCEDGQRRADQQRLSDLSPQQRADFQRFDGNAQTLRLITRLQVLADDYGLNLTLGTLSAAMKYTAASHEAGRASGRHELEKPGYFASETELVEMVRRHTGTGTARNPITFLTEAVDDLAYATVDFEDGIKKGLATWDDAQQELVEVARGLGCPELLRSKIDGAVEYLGRAKPPLRGRAKGESIAEMLRTLVIGKALADVSDAFIARHDAILAGDYHGELVADCASAGLIETFKQVDRKLFYASEGNLRLELMGRRVLGDLLSAFFEGAAAFEGEPPTPNDFPGKLYHLMSDNYRNVFVKAAAKDPSSMKVYPKLQLVTDYVCGMTDSFACSLHQSLTHG